MINASINISWRSGAAAIGLLLVLVLAWIAYQPGLQGGYLFDDFVNLNALGATGPVSDWSSFLRYITSGDADPTGRPLTLLSFLIDAQDWPADPGPFKYTSVLIHLLNGVLLCAVVLSIGRFVGLNEQRRLQTAVLTTAFWLLHPLFVSTTLYIVQREAMLPATFTLLGLLCWCRGRHELSKNKTFVPWLWMFTGAWFCTLMAVACKANGALLPALIAVAEGTVLRTSSVPDRQLRRARWVLLGLPVGALLIFILAKVPAAIASAGENRPWTIWQRLITEPRILLDYLRLLWLPRSTSFGVFNDQIEASSDLLHPWSTLPCVVLICALCFGGWISRRRWPTASFAILFYLVGQSMESTFLPLELSFEHRNYLPALFMFWPLSVWLTRPAQAYFRSAFAAVLIGGLTMLTWTRSEVWGDSREQALIWGRINPDSPRAQTVAAGVEMQSGNPSEAILRLRHAAKKFPNEVQVTLNLVSAECYTGQLTPGTWATALRSLENTTNGSRAMFNWFVASIETVKDQRCEGMSLEKLEEALSAAKKNLKFGQQVGRLQDFSHLAGLIAIAKGSSSKALTNFNEAYLARPDQGTALEQAAALGAAGYPRVGLAHLSFVASHPATTDVAWGMPRVHAWILERQHYWVGETSHLIDTLSADAEPKVSTLKQS